MFKQKQGPLTNIRNIMELSSRELYYDTGFELPPLRFNKNQKSPNMKNVQFDKGRERPQDVKAKTKADMLTCMNIYKDNYAQPQRESKLKFRQPGAVLRAVRALQVKPKARNRLAKPNITLDLSPSPDSVVSSPCYPTVNSKCKHTLKKSTQTMPLSEADYEKYIQGYTYRPLSVKETTQDMEMSSEKFYDLESSSYCNI